MSTVSSIFIDLNAFEGKTSTIIATGNDTFVAWCSKGLMEYNITNDTWNNIIQYPQDLNINVNNIRLAYDFNKTDQTWYYYLSNSNKAQLIKFNINTNKWQFHDVIHLGSYVKCIIINNKCNIIGGKKNNKHLIWKDDTKQFEEIYQFSEHENGYYLSQNIIFIQSKNMLLLFGGTAAKYVKKLGVIYKYNILKQEWKQLSVTMPIPYRVNFGVTSVMNNRYILLFGGWLDIGKATDDILIFCVKTQTFTTSKVKCPTSGIFKAITIHNNKENELTVFGYVRQILKDRFPPFYLVKLIQSWYWTGYTYIIEINSGKHWKVNTLDVL